MFELTLIPNSTLISPTPSLLILFPSNFFLHTFEIEVSQLYIPLTLLSQVEFV